MASLDFQHSATRGLTTLKIFWPREAKSPFEKEILIRLYKSLAVGNAAEMQLHFQNTLLTNDGGFSSSHSDRLHKLALRNRLWFRKRGIYTFRHQANLDCGRLRLDSRAASSLERFQYRRNLFTARVKEQVARIDCTGVFQFPGFIYHFMFDTSRTSNGGRILLVKVFLSIHQPLISLIVIFFSGIPSSCWHVLLMK